MAGNAVSREDASGWPLSWSVALPCSLHPLGTSPRMGASLPLPICPAVPEVRGGNLESTVLHGTLLSPANASVAMWEHKTNPSQRPATWHQPILSKAVLSGSSEGTGTRVCPFVFCEWVPSRPLYLNGIRVAFGCSAPARVVSEADLRVRGRQNGVPSTGKKGANSWEHPGGKMQSQTLPADHTAHTPLPSLHPARRAQSARKLGVGAQPEIWRRALRSAPCPGPEPRPSTPDAHPDSGPPDPPRARTPGRAPPQPPASRRLPGQPLPAAADSGSSREARAASNSPSRGGGGSSSGGSPGRPMLRLSAIGGDAAPCRARPASEEGGGRGGGGG